MTGVQLAALAVLVTLGLVAARLDIAERRLPHWLCGVTLAAGLAAALAIGGIELAASGLLHAVLALVGGILLFAAGMIGGGDAKFYAAVAAWFALRDGLFLLVTVSLSGLVLLVVWMVLRRRRLAVQPADPADPFAKLPYGVAIALGAVVSYAMLGMLR